LISLVAAAAVLSSLPDISRLDDIRRQPTVTYVDRSGALLGVRGGQYAPPVEVDRLPAYVPAAFVAIEDRRFYHHSGFDAIGMARALAADVGHGRIVEGASTITQQLARNLFLSPDQTVERKAQEVVLAVMLERRYTKKQILALYLSRVYFGGGAYGLEAAAQRFFDKPASRLTLAEAATLAGVLKSPARYSPAEDPARSAKRAAVVLGAMVDTGAITRAQWRKALAHPAKAYRIAPAASAQYFVDWVDPRTRQLVGQPKEDLVVETTLDRGLEARAADAARAVVAGHGRQGVQQAALIALDGAGRVRTLIGGINYADSQFDRATEARRQAGSAWKPFVYLTAMEAGRTPDTPTVDEPLTIGDWSPHNYTDQYLGPITLQTALAQSINTVAARLADEVGRDNVAHVAHRLGIESAINTDPAMALGTTQVTPLEMTQAYAAFSNGGDRAVAYGVERIRTVTGRVLYQHRVEPRANVIGNPALTYMNQMLRAVIAGGTGTRAAIPGYDLAGKTGTTSDYKDAWFCGYAGGVTTVVWVGRDDASPMRNVTGGGAPVELWRDFMTEALPRLHAQPIPPGPPAPVPVPPPAPEPAAPAATPFPPADAAGGSPRAD
jgi:penicillin-binding protein 1A